MNILTEYVMTIDAVLSTKGYIVRHPWEELKPKSIQDDALICAAIVVYEEIKKL